MSDRVCDFCTEEPAPWSHGASDFVYGTLERPVGSAGGWAACEACHGLLVANDREGLLTRATRSYERRHREIRGHAQVRAEMARVHESFWEHATGTWRNVFPEALPQPDGFQTLYNAEPFPEAPRYFVRVYQESPSRGASPAIDLVFGGEKLLIWGYSCRSMYAEDRAQEDEVWREHRIFPCMAFSEAELHGEYGLVGEDQVVPVDRWVLECALAELGVPWVAWESREQPASEAIDVPDVPGLTVAEAMVQEFRKRKAAFMQMPAPTMSEAERKLNEIIIGDPDSMTEIPDGYVAAEFSLGTWHPYGIGKSLKITQGWQLTHPRRPA